MSDLNTLFFELIRVAIGTQKSLSRLPSEAEWEELFDMAVKQSLVGICFIGLHTLGADSDDGFAKVGMSEDLFFDWMGMAAQINMKNELVNEQCVELQKRLAAEGFRSSILKGQGVATLYGEELRGFRQSGDIDVLMWKDGLGEKENRKAVIEYAKNLDNNAKASEHHIAVKVFDETEVEMHYSPAYMCNPILNRRFCKWCETAKIETECIKGMGLIIPSVEFNLVFLLAHAFRHYMSEGIGMRQMMDYYFVLRTPRSISNENLRKTLLSLGLLNFSGAVMWLMQEVFKLEKERMFCEPDERLGRKLLNHVMQGGNFGHHNTNTVASKGSHAGRFINQLTRDLKLATDYPKEALWAPLSMIREFIRIRI